MSVGNQPSTAQINNALTTQAIALRDTCQSIASLYEYLNTVGTSGLETLGFASADASSALTMVGYMNTVTQVYYGTQGQAAAGQTAADFDFDNALSGLWAAG